VFHVRALYYTKTLITNKCTKRVFIINRTTVLHVSTLLGHLQGELFVIVTLRLHFIVEWECAVDCVLRCFWRRERSVVPACRPGPHGVQASSTQSTAHSHSTIKCNLSVTITKCSPWRWPSRFEACRSVLQLMIKTLFVHLFVISVFEQFVTLLKIFVEVSETKMCKIHPRYRKILALISYELQ
jgi:hypothetical protein